jgi:hypothetical protein
MAKAGYTTAPGFENINRQRVIGPSRARSNHASARVHEIECLACGASYGANGCDIHIPKCSVCQGGKAGIEL